MVALRRSLLLTLLRAPQSARSGTRRLPIFCSLRDGLGRLVERLTDRMTATTTLCTGTSVTSVRRSDGGYELITPQGVRRGYAAVIVATPAWMAARLLAEAAPAAAAPMQRIRYVSSATVFFAFRGSDLRARPRGYGFLVPSCEARRINGATWITNKFDHRAPADGFLARCFIGGDRTGGELEADDDGLVRICREELREIAGISAEPLFSRVYRWRDSGPQYDVGHARRVEEIDLELAQHPGLFVSGSGYRGIGIPDCVEDGRAMAVRLVDLLGRR